MMTGAKSYCLILGVLGVLGGCGWAIIGTIFEADKPIRVWLFLLVGPFTALPAAILSQWRPRLGAACFIASGSAAYVLMQATARFPGPYFEGEVFFLVFLPMLAAGAWLLAASFFERKAAHLPAAAGGRGGSRPQDASDRALRPWENTGLFLLGFASAFILSMTGFHALADLRGAEIPLEWATSVREHDQAFAVATVALLLGATLLLRLCCKIPVSFILGVVVGLALFFHGAAK